MANQSAVCRTLGLRSIASLALSPGSGAVDDDLIRMEAVLTLAILQLGQIIVTVHIVASLHEIMVTY
jgi:hypothetical protein